MKYCYFTGGCSYDCRDLPRCPFMNTDLMEAPMEILHAAARRESILTRTDKPHLRLHYTPAKSPGNRSGAFPWSVAYVRGPNRRARRETYQHDTAWGALASAVHLWF